MPNWCENYLRVEHVDSNEIDKLLSAFEAGNLLEYLVPIGTWEYEKATNLWGTKWDIACDEIDSQTDRISPNNCVLSFYSAWSPPIEAYSGLTARGFKYETHYFEPGIMAAGSSRNGKLEEYYIDEYDDSLLDELPSDFLAIFGEVLYSYITECSKETSNEEEEEN